jgi:hypothetical protein
VSGGLRERKEKKPREGHTVHGVKWGRRDN